MNLSIFAVAVAFTLVSIGVFAHQRQAASCPLHKRWIGKLAMALGTICALVALALFVAAYAMTSLNSF